jgi:hypothetical protein
MIVSMKYVVPRIGLLTRMCWQAPSTKLHDTEHLARRYWRAIQVRRPAADV